MERPFIELTAWGQLRQGTEVHDADPAADVAHHAQVVGDKEVGEMKLLLEILEHVDDLGLDGGVEGGDGFIAEDEFGL